VGLWRSARSLKGLANPPSVNRISNLEAANGPQRLSITSNAARIETDRLRAKSLSAFTRLQRLPISAWRKSKLTVMGTLQTSGDLSLGVNRTDLEMT